MRLDLQRGVADAETRLQQLRGLHQKRVDGACGHHEMTRQRRLGGGIGQTWRSWIAETPGRASRNALIAARSVPLGAAAMDMSMEPRSRLVVPHRMLAQMTRLVTG